MSLIFFRIQLFAVNFKHEVLHPFIRTSMFPIQIQLAFDAGVHIQINNKDLLHRPIVKHQC